MADMIFTVDGVDLMPYVAHKGMKWSRNDIDAPDAGRTMDGTMMRGRVATKIRLDITCRPMRSSELMIVLNALMPETVQVRYKDPKDGIVTRTMYANNNPAECEIAYDNDMELWTGITFPLVEV